MAEVHTSEDNAARQLADAVMEASKQMQEAASEDKAARQLVDAVMETSKQMQAAVSAWRRQADGGGCKRKPHHGGYTRAKRRLHDGGCFCPLHMSTTMTPQETMISMASCK